MPMHQLDEHVVTIDRDSAPRIIPFGEDFWLEDLPEGTRVIYPPAPLKGLENPEAAIRYAVTHPLGQEPLYARLEPGMKVTIALDDISLPLPQMQTPDVRERILNVVLNMLADYMVEDIHIIIATSLHRRMTEAETKRMVGKKIFDKFWPKRLYNHDAEDPNGIIRLGETPEGDVVEINRRAAESDLVIYVNINLVPMDGGHKSVGIGLSNYRTLCSHHNPAVLRKTETYMQPNRSHMHQVVNRIGKFVNQHLKIFHIETVLNNDMYGSQLSFQ